MFFVDVGEFIFLLVFLENRKSFTSTLLLSFKSYYRNNPTNRVHLMESYDLNEGIEM